MPHCPPDLLDDLAGLLTEVRAWPDVVEKSAGVFYVRKQPFLHFHLLQGRHRRADVKGRTEWSQLELPRPISAANRRRFLRELRRRYAEK